jgi:ATP-dependent DNA helicase RecG
MVELLTGLRGVGDALAAKLQVLGLRTVEDLVQNIPRRYEDYSQITSIDKLKPGTVTIQAEIKQAKGRYARRGLHITEAVASDTTGSVRLVWFNQPYRAAALKQSEQYFISGEFGLNYRHLSIMNPSVELVSEFPVNTARIVPIYRETKGITSKQIRKIVRETIPYIRSLPETLPQWIIDAYKLQNYAKALETLHFPANARELEAAKKRLGFQEVFELILASLLVKQEVVAEPAHSIPFHEDLAKQFVASLPFQLTDAQRKVVWQIYQDMQQTHPMNRLVEGDVGSGKTVVAAMAALAVSHEGMQTAFMAPTELLARQHADTMYKLLEPLGLQESVVLLVGGMKPAEKKRAHTAIASGQAKIIIGTHALIQEKVDMHTLALIVIDEQHRFGVEQRKKLMAKAGKMPHVLSLTATPIPRSLALTLYGELDISLLDVKPEGRQAVKTEICSPNSRKQLYEKIDEELAAGRQMFVVCPLISESDSSAARSVEKVYAEMTKAFTQRKVGLLHGKMKADEKNDIMREFVNGNIDILVSTTVIEVGVDVPNASIMLIESAERFGLAQIHQLRGRVGRGGFVGYCYLMTSDSSAPSRRLRALETSNDGFKLAELDLELRGPGAIYGTLQHGALDLRIASLGDTKLISQARIAAESFMKRQEKLVDYPILQTRIQHLQKVNNLN